MFVRYVIQFTNKFFRYDRCSPAILAQSINTP